MGNLFGTMDSSFSKWVLLIAKISVTSEVIYEKLQRNYGKKLGVNVFMAQILGLDFIPLFCRFVRPPKAGYQGTRST